MRRQTDLLSGADLYFRHPLYAPIDLTGLAVERRAQYLETVEFPKDTIDGYCTECEMHSVFGPAGYPDRLALFQTAQELLDDMPHRFRTQEAPIHRPVGRGDPPPATRSFPVVFECRRSVEHKAVFVFRSTPQNLTKIGQYPSIADEVSPRLERYKKVLGQEKSGELHRAVGLASHGIGIGAFVYLRRIFEHLIDKAHQTAQKQVPDWDEAAYETARMEDKIRLMKDFLPHLLVENWQLYSILSKGIHELSEDECKQHFEVVLQGIQLILEEELERRNRQEREGQFQRQLHKTREDLKRRDTEA
jgi:hypothetical protein